MKNVDDKEKLSFGERSVAWWHRNKETVKGTLIACLTGYGLGSFIADVSGLRKATYDNVSSKSYTAGFFDGQKNAANVIANVQSTLPTNPVK